MGTLIIKVARICSGCGQKVDRRHTKCPNCRVAFTDSELEKQFSRGAQKICSACRSPFPNNEGECCPNCLNYIGNSIYQCNSCGAVFQEETNYCSICGCPMAAARDSYPIGVCNHQGSNGYCANCGAPLD